MGGKGALPRESSTGDRRPRGLKWLSSTTRRRCDQVGASADPPVEARHLAQLDAKVGQIDAAAIARAVRAVARADAASFASKPFLTDNGNYVVDVYRSSPIGDAARRRR